MDEQGFRYDVQILAKPESKVEEKKKGMNSVSTFLLDTCFWNFLDAGTIPEQTPLLTGMFEGRPLAEVLRFRFGVSTEQAEFEIEAARSELEL